MRSADLRSVVDGCDDDVDYLGQVGRRGSERKPQDVSRKINATVNNTVAVGLDATQDSSTQTTGDIPEAHGVNKPTLGLARGVVNATRICGVGRPLL